MKAVHALGVLIIICASCAPAVGTSPTSTPVATATVRQATATQRPTDTPTPDPYEVTMEKLNNQPESMEYLKAHLDEFVQAPSPMDLGIEVFYRWVDEKLYPVVGSPGERAPNVVIDVAGIGQTRVFSSSFPDWVVPIGEIPFFYFLHNDEPYLVYILNGQKRGKEATHDMMGVVIIDGWGMSSASEVVRDVYYGDVPFRRAEVILDPTDYFGYIPDEIAQFIRDTRFGSSTDEAPRRLPIGFGSIVFQPLP